MQYIKTFFASTCLIVFLFVPLNAQTQQQNSKQSDKEKKETSAKQTPVKDKLTVTAEKEIYMATDSSWATRQGNWFIEKNNIENKKVEEEIIPPD